MFLHAYDRPSSTPLENTTNYSYVYVNILRHQTGTQNVLYWPAGIIP